MSIQFLNCGTIRPYFPKVQGGIACLLVDTNQGPVLVDTGLGAGDYLHPGRLMRFFTSMMRSPRVPRIRGFIKAHPEVQVVGSHMALDFYQAE